VRHALTENRLTTALAALRARRALGAAPFVTAGDGGLARTLAVLHGLAEGGAAVIELGVPFSDPVADGPALAAAAQRALGAGTTLAGVAEVVRVFRSEGGAVPIAVFAYTNTLLAGGLARNLALLADAGVDGLLVPDAPVEELTPFVRAAGSVGLAVAAFVAPTTSPLRARAAAELAAGRGPRGEALAPGGFVYAIGRVGVTGAATEVDSACRATLTALRDTLGDVPLGVGFGLRARAQVRALEGVAELAIVGTALVAHVHAAAQGAAADPDGVARAAARGFLEAFIGTEKMDGT